MGARPAIHPGQTACDETRAAQFSRWGLGRRSIPAKQPVMKPTRPSSPGGGSAGDPSRLNRVAFAPLIVALRSEYTRYSSLTRLVSPAPRPHRETGQPRRSRGFHHRLFTASLRAAHRCVSVEIHQGQFSRWGLLPHAPCQPGASPPPGDWPASALTRVPPQAVHHSASPPHRENWCSALRFGRNTPGPVLPVGAPPSRALSAGPPPGGLAPPGELGLAALGAHPGSTTGC